ncbi:MAG TPA: biopolymer transporter ExbD [Candidatus Hydrogenedentes bacterium]|nr:biopolymer transporter ExbD [Candidatus Hydrogenedentota bacterium]HOS02051.1 biopolymer transporter ExbD [Candidatus Hydrogenedentota bacterium]
MDFRRGRKRKLVAEMSATPIINVVFLLLAFFLLSSSFVTRPPILLHMPATQGARTVDPQDATVSLLPPPGGPDDKGPVFFNDEEVATMRQLGQLLTEARQRRPEMALMIRPDARVDTGRLVEVLGLANSVGIVRYRIPAQSPTETAP